MNKLLTFVVLDIETTGFDFSKEEIIEIGAVKYIKGEKKDTFSIFIKPKKEVPIFIKQLTHITDEQLNSGVKIKEALKLLLNFIDDIPIVCHNSPFDIGFINRKLIVNGFDELSNPIYDTLALSRIYFPFATNHKLGSIADYLDINLQNAHRAIYDAEATGEIFIKIVNFIEKNISLTLNKTIHQICSYAELGSDVCRVIEIISNYQQKNALLSKKSISHKNVKNRAKNYFIHKPTKIQTPSLEEIFNENGYFDKSFDKYEIRTGQIEMSQAVLYNLENKNILMAEAGTGVGKSFAYMIPALLHTQKDESKAVISTNTKNLQEQLFHKDIPLIAKTIPMEFSAAILKGRRNYICEKRWREVISNAGAVIAEYEARAILYLLVWKEQTRTGDITENTSFNTNSFSGMWKKVVADRHFCRGRKCTYYSECYLMDIRKKADKANIVIINHHLLIADMLSENSALGNYDHLIIDEAHNLPRIAPSEFGTALSYSDFNSFLSQLYNSSKSLTTGILMKLKADTIKSGLSSSKKDLLVKKIDSLADYIDKRKKSYSRFFEKVSKIVNDKGHYGKYRIKNIEEQKAIFKKLASMEEDWLILLKDVESLKENVSQINSSIFPNYDENLDNFEASSLRIMEYLDVLSRLAAPDFDNNAFWLSLADGFSKAKNNGVINYAPLKVGDYFNDFLYSKDKSILFTSATLSIRGKFKYFANKMGLDLAPVERVNDIVVTSPFDYPKQSAALVANMLPVPQDKKFVGASLDLVKQIILEADKGIMILFTSYYDLNYFYDKLKDVLYSKHILLLAQGKGMSRSTMLQEFKKDKKAVLLGTNSFWEGVDIPGEALSILVLAKLPFLVPSEPIVEAYIDLLKLEGKDSFMHYMLPNALLRYKQGFGRLIRNKTDKGLVIVLDNRVTKKYYGKYFKDILPTKTNVILSKQAMLDFIKKWYQ